MREKSASPAPAAPEYKYLPVHEEDEVKRLRAELSRPIPEALRNVWPKDIDRRPSGEVIPLSDLTKEHLKAEEARLSVRIIVRVRRNDTLIQDKKYQGLELEVGGIRVGVPLESWIAMAPAVVEVIERTYVSLNSLRTVREQTVDTQDLGYDYKFEPVPEFIVEHWDAEKGTIKPREKKDKKAA